MKQNKFSEKSFTLAEVIIVIAIFCLLITSIYSIYLLNQKAYFAGESAAEIIQNGRVILERMIREIRQAKKIISIIPEEKADALDEIEFQDGHDLFASHFGNSQGGDFSSIILSSSAENTDNYYKDLYVRIISGTGIGQAKKIYEYTGYNKTAVIEGFWDTVPDVSSVYKIDSFYYYIRYYKDNEKRILRELYTYCFSQDGLACADPETYVANNSAPPPGQSLLKIQLEEPKIIGEYVDGLDIWGFGLINIFIELGKNGKEIDLETKIFGRNL